DHRVSTSRLRQAGGRRPGVGAPGAGRAARRDLAPDRSLSVDARSGLATSGTHFHPQYTLLRDGGGASPSDHARRSPNTLAKVVEGGPAPFDLALARRGRLDPAACLWSAIWRFRPQEMALESARHAEPAATRGAFVSRTGLGRPDRGRVPSRSQ